MAHTACVLANHLNASAIAATTHSDFTAMQSFRFRPHSCLIVLSSDPVTVRLLSLDWGCIPHFAEETKNTDEQIEKAGVSALETEKVNKGDLVVIAAGHPVEAAVTTNMIRVMQL